LANVNSQHTLRRSIAYNTDHHGKVDDMLKVINFNDISQKSRKKGPTAQGNNTQVCSDPQTKGVIVIQIRCVEGKAPGRQCACHTPQYGDLQDAEPYEKGPKGTSFNTLWD
jgi:hypothetical protein